MYHEIDTEQLDEEDLDLDEEQLKIKYKLKCFATEKVMDSLELGMRKLDDYINGRQPAIETMKTFRYFNPSNIKSSNYQIKSIINSIKEYIRPFKTIFKREKNIKEYDNEYLKLKLDKQLEEYITLSKNDSINEPTLEFWSSKIDEWPELANLVLGILTIPVTSAEVERFFSFVNQIVTSQRCSFIIENLRNYLSIYYNKTMDIDLD
jgi:hypothetical protein